MMMLTQLQLLLLLELFPRWMSRRPKVTRTLNSPGKRRMQHLKPKRHQKRVLQSLYREKTKTKAVKPLECTCGCSGCFRIFGILKQEKPRRFTLLSGA